MIKYTKKETIGTHTVSNVKLENGYYINYGEETEQIRVLEFNILSGLERIQDLNEFIETSFAEIVDFIGDDKKIGVKINLNDKFLKTTYSKDVTQADLTRRLKRNFMLFDDFFETQSAGANPQENPYNANVSDDRLAKGMYRTIDQQNAYIKESLEKE